MKRTLTVVFAAALAGGLAGGVLGIEFDHRGSEAETAQAATPTVSVRPADATVRPAADLTPAQVYRADAAAVVVITATQTQEVPPTLFTPAQKEEVKSLGSGFVIDRRGDIVTNDHVVDGASGIRVGFNGGASYPASIVGTDPSTDVAVVRVNAPPSALHPLSFGGSAHLSVGDPVFAIGNPFGLDRTMTAGIVSAVGRDIQAPNGVSIPNAIQTDAPINHGNSGGPLLDAAGHVVGVNAQIEGGTVDGNVGIGFAIPSDTAGSVIEQLIAHGRAEHAWLGVEVETIDPAVTKLVRGLPSHGVAVTQIVAKSPAAKAGLHASTRELTVNGVTVPIGGDMIVAANGKPISSSTQLSAAVALHKPGDRLTLRVVRRGVARTVTVTLGDTPNLR
jgi:S1-C subfamily serine protease